MPTISNIHSTDQYAAQSLPRYTSYPTANHFKNKINSKEKAKWLKSLSSKKPVSVYIHVPFCDRLCWFCGCHTKQVKRYDPIKAYIDAVIKEIMMTRQLLPSKLEIAHLHLGGGSPSLLSCDDFLRLREALNSCFKFTQATEISIEIDPKDNNHDLKTGLEAVGITRASLGVQDFNDKVQSAINRPQSFEETAAMYELVKQAGARSVNIDVLYGLPHQTIPSVARTIMRVIELNPDRIAMFGYAHVPWLKKHQKMIDENTLPDAPARVHQALAADCILEEANYVKIGLDHYAKPHDTLALAQKAKCLHRNFQGYTADRCDVLIGFGASAISYLDHGYVQNTVATGRYMADTEEGILSVERGIELNKDDHICRFIIERLMCDFQVEFDQVEKRFGNRISKYLQIAKAIPDTLAEYDGSILRIHSHRRPFVRVVASHFDSYLAFSKAKHSLVA